MILVHDTFDLRRGGTDLLRTRGFVGVDDMMALSFEGSSSILEISDSRDRARVDSAMVSVWR